MLRPLTPDNVHDLRLSGQVISVGRSSLEIAVKMESVSAPGHDETLLIGILHTISLFYSVCSTLWIRSILDGLPRRKNAQSPSREPSRAGRRR